MNKKILISGGNGNLASHLLKCSNDYDVTALDIDKMDVTDLSQIESSIIKYTPDYFIHTAALTRPMSKHIDSPDKSIQANIIGTSNVAIMCYRYNIKLVYISTDYVYPGIKGNYSETDALLPVNEYAWSKLGGECAVNLYKNSLILRMALCETPFPHKKALCDINKSYIYMDKAAKIILKLKDQFGVINVGGKAQTPYEFIKSKNKDIGKIYLNDIQDVSMAKDASLNVTKLNGLV